MIDIREILTEIEWHGPGRTYLTPQGLEAGAPAWVFYAGPSYYSPGFEITFRWALASEMKCWGDRLYCKEIVWRPRWPVKLVWLARWDRSGTTIAARYVAGLEYGYGMRRRIWMFRK